MEIGKVGRSIILFTDFGPSSPFAGIIRCVIKSINPHVDVVDFSHSVTFGSVIEAAFILKRSYKYFPFGSLIVCVIDPDVGTDRKIIALYKIEKDMIFLAPDNGLLYSLFSQDDKIFIIDEDTFWLKPLSNTFHGRDIFAPVSAFISLGVPIITLGTKAKVDEITKLEIPQPYVGGDYIEGISLFRDPFGNIITNIDEELIKDKRIANITVGDKKVSGLYKNFSEAKGKGLSATVGSFGTIEIFVYLDSAADVIGNFKDLRVKITFE